MNYLDTVKNVFKSKERKTENLILLIVLLVLLLIAVNYIFKSEEDEKSNNLGLPSNINSSEKEDEGSDSSDINVEEKLESILSKISGIEDVSVMLTYSSGSKQNLAYNVAEEETNDGKTKSEKSVAYNEKSGQKDAIVESIETPKVQGVIIVARGASSVEIKSKIATAVAMAVDVPVYKVQVFEK